MNIIKTLKEIHKLGVIHRDIKPVNICYGSFSQKDGKFDNSMKIIDFGLAKKFTIKIFRDSAEKRNDFFIGTLTFASTTALTFFLRAIPKDDLESIFYVIAYLKNGSSLDKM